MDAYRNDVERYAYWILQRATDTTLQRMAEWLDELTVSESVVRPDGDDRWRVEYSFDFAQTQRENATIGLDPGFNFNMARLTAGIAGGVRQRIAENQGTVPKGAELESWIEEWFVDHLIALAR